MHLVAVCCVCVSGEGGHVSDTNGAEDCGVLNGGEEKNDGGVEMQHFQGQGNARRMPRQAVQRHKFDVILKKKEHHPEIQTMAGS